MNITSHHRAEIARLKARAKHSLEWIESLDELEEIDAVRRQLLLAVPKIVAFANYTEILLIDLTRHANGEVPQ